MRFPRVKWYRKVPHELVVCSSIDKSLFQIVICTLYCKYHKDTASHFLLLVCFLFALAVALFFVLLSHQKKEVLLDSYCQEFFSVLCATLTSVTLSSCSSTNLSSLTMNWGSYWIFIEVSWHKDYNKVDFIDRASNFAWITKAPTQQFISGKQTFSANF